MKKYSEPVPAVSIIVPVYNPGERLPICLESILRQDFPDFELILVDDGSTDGSRDVCEKAAASDERIRFFHQENSGPGAARNTGIAAARAPWICFVDADDTIDKDFLSSLFSARPGPGDLVITGYRHSYADGRPDRSDFIYEKSVSPDDPSFIISRYKLLNEGMPTCKLFDKALLETYGIRYDTRISLHEDHVFSLKYLLRCKNIHLVAGVHATYWHDPSRLSLTAKKHPTGRLLVAAEQLYSLFLDLRKKYPHLSRYGFRLQFCDYGLQIFINAYKAAETKEEKAAAAKAIRKRWFDYIKYYRKHWNRGDRKLVARILLGIA